MTTPNTFQTQPNAFQHAPFINRIHHIMGATRVEIALRAQDGRYCQLVKPNGQDEYFLEQTVEIQNVRFKIQNIKVSKQETLWQGERMEAGKFLRWDEELVLRQFYKSSCFYWRFILYLYLTIKPFIMKRQGVFVIFFVLVGIATFIFSGYSNIHQVARETEDETTFILTVESNNVATPGDFNITISKEEGETIDFKSMENQRTPFIKELSDGDYLIVVHATDKKGNITSKVEKRINNTFKASAEAEGKVMVLTTKKEKGRLSAFDMN